MINENEIKTYEDIERAIVKRLLEKTRTEENKKQKINDIKTLNEYLGLRYCNNKNSSKLTTEYLKFLIRFYNPEKSKGTTNKIIQRFLKTMDKKYDSLNISSVYTTYRKLIHNRIKDYCLKDDEEFNKVFENSAVNSHTLTHGTNTIHYI